MEELAVAALPRFITSSHKLSLFDEVVFNNLRLGSGTVTWCIPCPWMGARDGRRRLYPEWLGCRVEVMSNVGQVAFDFVRSHATSVSRPGIVGSMQLDLHRSL